MQTFEYGDLVEITTPTSDRGLRKPLIVRVSKQPEPHTGMWIVTGERMKPGRKTSNFPDVRRWIATSVKPYTP
jgi:hypothetical protein